MEFRFNIRPSNEYSGLISFRMDWLDLKSINSSALSFLYSPTLTSIHDHQKKHSLDHRSKVISLLFNMLSRLIISFLPRSKHLLISWLQSPSALILEPPKIKSVTVSPSICHEVMGPDAMIFLNVEL